MITYTQNQLINISIPADSSDPMPLFDTALSEAELAIRNSGRQVIVNRYIKSLRAYCAINSIPPVALPQFNELESNFERNLKIRAVEWKGARKHLNLLYRSNGSQWIERGLVSLTNRDPLPYFDANLLEFYTEGLAIELGELDQLAVSIEDVGFGLLSSNDSIRIYGNLVGEYILQDPPEQNMELAIEAWQPLLLLNGWENYSPNLPPPRMRIDPLGIIHLSGLLKGGSNYTIAQIPDPRFIASREISLPIACYKIGSGIFPSRLFVANGMLTSSEIQMEWFSLEGSSYWVD